MPTSAVRLIEAAEAAACPIRDFRSPRVDLNDKVVLVTGGTGSFGKAFARMVCAEFQPRKLIVFSRDELKQYEMAQAFPPERHPFMRWFIGDVRDRERLETAMRGVDYVVHAAAPYWQAATMDEASGALLITSIPVILGRRAAPSRGSMNSCLSGCVWMAGTSPGHDGSMGDPSARRGPCPAPGRP